MIKKSSLAGRERLQELNSNEIDVITEMDHAHIVKVIELIEDPYHYYIVM